MKAFCSFIFLLVISLFASGQETPQAAPDTVLLNNGLVVVTHVVDTIGEMVTVVKPNSRKHKQTEIEKEAIFSIRFGSTGKEEIYYIYDTLVGHDFSVPEARKFIEGEQDAQRGFHAIGISAVSFAVGFVSGASIGSLIAFGPPFIFAGVTTYPRIRVRHHSVRNKANGTDDAYLLGYDTTARRKRTLRSFLWGGVGLIAGLVVHFTALTTP